MTTSETTAPAILAPKGPYGPLDCPTRTPWGEAQDIDILMYGADAAGFRVPVLWQVHTAGHGGTRVHRELAARFLNGIPKACHAYGGSRLWYEEDCESSVPLFIFYNGLSADCWLVTGDKPFPREQLLESIRRWLPETVWVVRMLAARFDDALAEAGVALRSPLAKQD